MKVHWKVYQAVLLNGCLLDGNTALSDLNKPVSCRSGIVAPVFDSFQKPFPPQEPWLDVWQVGRRANPSASPPSHQSRECLQLDLS